MLGSLAPCLLPSTGLAGLDCSGLTEACTGSTWPCKELQVLSVQHTSASASVRSWELQLAPLVALVVMGGCIFWVVECLCEGLCAEKRENGNLVICRKESSNITLAGGGGASQHSDSKRGGAGGGVG